RTALRRLPDEPRRSLELAYFERLTQTEIAAILQTRLGTVKTRIRTALATLRRSPPIMSSQHHERIVELLEEYALDQLGTGERNVVEAHLRDCAICTQVLFDTREALALLAETAPPVQPPPA